MGGRVLYNFILSGNIFILEDLSSFCFSELLREISEKCNTQDKFKVITISNLNFFTSLKRLVLEEGSSSMVVLCVDVDNHVKVGKQNNRYHAYDIQETFKYDKVITVGVIQSVDGVDLTMFNVTNESFNVPCNNTLAELKNRMTSYLANCNKEIVGMQTN